MTATYIHADRNSTFLRLILRFFALLYLAAVAACVVYVWKFTQDRYVSEAAFKISKQSSASAETGIAQVMLPGLADSGAMDSQVVIGYINSVEFLLQLEKEFDLINHYSSPTQDIVFRLDREDPLEDRIEFYRNRITSHYATDTGLTMLSVDTFDPVLSKRIADSILEKSDAFVNRINQSIAGQQVAFIQSEMDCANRRVNELTEELLDFQNKGGFISPDDKISTSVAAVRELQMKQLGLNAELTTTLRDSPDSPTIGPLRSQLRSVSELIDMETAKLSGPEVDRLNKVLVEFRELQHKLEFAYKLRSNTELLMEQNRVESIARSRFFMVIQQPFLPEDEALPRRAYSSTMIVVLGLLLFFVLRALSSSLVDRQ